MDRSSPRSIIGAAEEDDEADESGESREGAERDEVGGEMIHPGQDDVVLQQANSNEADAEHHEGHAEGTDHVSPHSLPSLMYETATPR